MFAVALKVIGRILPPVKNLLLNPRPAGCKTLQGGDREWRIRVGDYRVVHTIDDPNHWLRLRTFVTADVYQ